MKFLPFCCPMTIIFLRWIFPRLPSFAAFLCAFVALAFYGAAAGAQDVSSELKEALQYQSSATFYGEPIRRISLVKDFYQDRAFVPGWDARAMESIAQMIGESEEHGLRPADYHQKALEKAREKNDLPALEILASDAYFLLASHLANGRVNVASLVDTWTASQDAINYVDYLRDALRNGEIAVSLRALAPQGEEYAAYRKELARYRTFAHGGFPAKVEPGEILRAGMASDPRIAALRARMIAFGAMKDAGKKPKDVAPPPKKPEELDLAAEIASEETFDDDLREAVKKFQRGANLIDDGVVGKSTLQEINRDPAERAMALRVNMERLRWLPKDLGARYIAVNIADFSLRAVENGKTERYHQVVVGSDYRQTPIFSAKMQYLVFNPWWMAPDKLAREDKLPVFQKNPEKAEELGFEVTDRHGNKVNLASIDWNAVDKDNFPYRLNQRPGDLNALGKVKFIFPNPHNVYLHDTPARELFKRKRRDFSSGCVRVKDPMDLAEWVLRGSGWTREKIDKAVESGKEKHVNLPRPLPVHILYLTNSLSESGDVIFLNDLYNRDKPVADALGK